MHATTTAVTHYFHQKLEQILFFLALPRERHQLFRIPTRPNDEPTRYWLPLGRKHALDSYNQHQHAIQPKRPESNHFAHSMNLKKFYPRIYNKKIAVSVIFVPDKPSCQQ